MKKIGISFVLILILVFSALPVSAAELTVQNGTADVNLSVTVPEKHKVTINVPSDVKVYFNGITANELYFSRLENVVLDIKVKDGYQVTKIMFGNIDVTKYYSNEKLTLSGINIDGLELKIETEKIPTSNSPQTGDGSNTCLWLAILFLSGAGLFESVVATKKKRANR